MTSNICSASAYIREYEVDPSVALGIDRSPAKLDHPDTRSIVSPVRDQFVGVGPHPTVSAAFGPSTYFITVRFGFNDHNLDATDATVYYDIHLDPLPGVTGKWRNREIEHQQLSLAKTAPVVLAVGPGSRIAFLAMRLTAVKARDAAPAFDTDDRTSPEAA